MILELKPFKKTYDSTLSELTIDGRFHCYILEDKDRGLHSGMSLDEIKAIKVKKATAIPAGTYEVVISWSDRFQQYMPLLLNVPGFDGIRIHTGNKIADTDGCLLPGYTYSMVDKNYAVGDSKKAYVSLLKEIKGAVKREKVKINVQR